MKQTRQAVHTIKQSIFLRCLWLWRSHFKNDRKIIVRRFVNISVELFCEWWSGKYFLLVRLSREVLLKGKAQYGWPPCTNQSISAPFYIENIINLFYKTSYFNEEVNSTEPSPLVSIPWSTHTIICRRICLFVLLSVCSSIHLSLSPSISQFICLFIC
jgi:hypothetical protein